MNLIPMAIVYGVKYGLRSVWTRIYRGEIRTNSMGMKITDAVFGMFDPDSVKKADRTKTWAQLSDKSKEYLMLHSKPTDPNMAFLSGVKRSITLVSGFPDMQYKHKFGSLDKLNNERTTDGKEGKLEKKVSFEPWTVLNMVRHSRDNKHKMGVPTKDIEEALWWAQRHAHYGEDCKKPLFKSGFFKNMKFQTNLANLGK